MNAWYRGERAITVFNCSTGGIEDLPAAGLKERLSQKLHPSILFVPSLFGQEKPPCIGTFRTGCPNRDERYARYDK
jgi:hypothetical protein